MVIWITLAAQAAQCAAAPPDGEDAAADDSDGGGREVYGEGGSEGGGQSGGQGGGQVGRQEEERRRIGATSTRFTTLFIYQKRIKSGPVNKFGATFFADAQQHGMAPLITPRYSYLLPEFSPKKQFVAKVDNMNVNVKLDPLGHRYTTCHK